jgi:hypothetical protein
MRRDELLLEFVLNSIANGYENFGGVKEQINKWASEEQIEITADEIAMSLEDLIRKGLARAHILSAQRPHSEIAKFSRERINEYYYDLSPTGRRLMDTL